MAIYGKNNCYNNRKRQDQNTSWKPLIIGCVIPIVVMTIVAIQCISNDLHLEIKDLAKRTRREEIMSQEENISDLKWDSMDSVVESEVKGELCVGSEKGPVLTCCVKVQFSKGDELNVNVTVGPRGKYQWMKGFYMHNNEYRAMECNIEEKVFWTMFIKGHQPIKVNSSPEIGETPLTKQGSLQPLNIYDVRSWIKYVEPEKIQENNISSDDISNREWQIQISREFASVKLGLIFTEVEIVFPNVNVWPKKINVQEGHNIRLSCNVQLQLPYGSTMSWSKGNDFRGSVSYGLQVVIHKGIVGKVEWSKQNFTYSLTNLKVSDQGEYQCCINIVNQERCSQVKIVVNPHPANITCVNKSFIPSSPFQINYFHSKPLLMNGQFMTIMWHFNLSNWKISSRFPQCRKYLINMEQGMENWFGKMSKNITRSKRDLIEKVLGGIGTLGTITNSMGISSLQKNLENVGLLDSKAMYVQRGLNQILNNMIVKTASVFGPSVLHLQDITIGLLNSENAAQVSRICMEIQMEYSTDFKVIAQALQGGISPLGIRNSLPKEYKIALNHVDLWVNKWIGCKNSECLGTSLIPIAGEEVPLYSMSVLGIPISQSQLLYYNLQFNDFIVNSTAENPVQVDLSACLRFNSKVLCLPHQLRPIYHSCFHNHSTCTARIEDMKCPFELVTPLQETKVCLQVMAKTELVKVYFSTCTEIAELERGLYCIDKSPLGILLQGILVNIPQILTTDIASNPFQFNISLTNEFPWLEWAKQIQKDEGLLHMLKKRLQKTEIIFQHEQGKLKEIEHEYSEMSGSSWWRKMTKSVNMWSKTSVGTAVGNILIHPLVILLLIILFCIGLQMFVMCKTRYMYNHLKEVIEQSGIIFKQMVYRKAEPPCLLAKTADSCQV
ncbi:uncharacterized protein LOC121403669 [Xenopus laevis]|uniref:Uncharacterized protein LOC121403669 n=1 Tax=Xenopus laevis TaxID=8355 RepID=A0A8J1N0P4_XENLA|nr:uncharacterized protein LOC121403669 [Xenopus laevis]